MNNRIPSIAVAALFTLIGCGGGESGPANSQSSIPPALSPPANSNSVVTSEGQIGLPANESTFTGNVLLAVKASSANGLEEVALKFAENAALNVLCGSGQTCGGNEFSETISGINPGDYGAQPGPITIELQVTDSLQQTATVSTLSINWQPPTINNVQATRSANGSEITVSWSSNPELLRYSLYLASQAGVSQSSYQNLPDGQALLAVESGPQSFSNLSPTKNYFVLLTGIDGSGESTNLNEISLPASGVIPNSDPVANDDFETLDEDTTLSIDVLQNDTDVDGDALTVTAATAATGTATIQVNEVFYEPPLDFNGNTTINYTISDGNGGIASADVVIQVTAINDAPKATADSVDINQDTAVNIDVLANDFDVDGDVLSIQAVNTNAGAVTIEADDTLTYDPPPGFVGSDSFDYTINDGNGETANATVDIDVGLVSRQPIANPDNYIALAGQLLNIDDTQGLLVNDADPDADPISVTVAPIQNTTSGALTLATDGSFTYQPNPGFTGLDSFDYQVIASNGQTASATASIDVRAIPANLAGDSTTISGELLYIGQGEISAGSGRGSGLYRVGDCFQDTNTRCGALGTYTESPGSGNAPNQTGRYAFMQAYGGAGNSPVLAESTTPGGNVLSFNQIGDVTFDLFLFPDNGGIVKAGYPENPFANSLNFGAFIVAPLTCAGLPGGTACNIGQVGLNAGSQLSAPLDRLNFSQPGVVLASDNNASPQANLDTFNVVRDTVLTVNAPGVMSNDTDPDTPLIGDDLQVLSQFSPGIGALTAIGFDEYRQLIYTANNFGPTIQVNDRLSAAVTNFPILGEATNNVDIEITSEAMLLAGTTLPQGTLLFINGETGTAEIYAFDTQTGVLLSQLNTDFGNGDVVGGAYNPQTQTLFLVQETQVGTGDPVIAEIDTNTGASIQQFSGAFQALDFDVAFGDLDVNNETGTLYITGSGEIGILELNPNGGIVRVLAIPPGVINPSGIAVNQSGDRIWLSSNNGDVYELSYTNQGVAPQLQASTVVTTENGVLISGNDGSFIYTPNAGFVGEDIFTYQIVDRKGKNSLNNVRINVTN